MLVAALDGTVAMALSRNGNDRGWLRRLARAGLRVATRPWVIAGCIALPFSTGCLVTEDIVFEPQDDVPPALVFRPRAMPPIGGTIKVDSDALSEAGMTNIEFNLKVRDENSLQALQTQARLRTLASPTFGLVSVRLDDGQVPVTGMEVRDFRFSVPVTQLRGGHCHQLQLAVSGEFVPSDEEIVFGIPLRSGDVAIATWWLWETSADGTRPVNPDTCPTDEL